MRVVCLKCRSERETDSEAFTLILPCPVCDYKTWHRKKNEPILSYPTGQKS